MTSIRPSYDFVVYAGEPLVMRAIWKTYVDGVYEPVDVTGYTVTMSIFDRSKTVLTVDPEPTVTVDAAGSIQVYVAPGATTALAAAGASYYSVRATLDDVLQTLFRGKLVFDA